jgi:hypothetical protein
MPAGIIGMPASASGMPIDDSATMTPTQAMDDVERAIGLLAGVRAWLMRHEADVSALTARDAHQLASCQWNSRAAADALYHTCKEIGRMDLRVFASRK